MTWMYNGQMKKTLFLMCLILLAMVGAFYSVTGAVTPCGAVRNRLEVVLVADVSGEGLAALAMVKDSVLDLAMAKYDLTEFRCVRVLNNHYLHGFTIQMALNLDPHYRE